MWPFSKKYSLIDTDVFRGWTDRHSHILPGVDDGIQTMNDSIAVLAFYEQLGVSDVWLTPHIMEDCPNTPSHLRQRFDELCGTYQQLSSQSADDPSHAKVNGSIRLHLAAENMLDVLFVKRLEAGNLLPYGDDGKELLVETSYVQPPHRFKELLQDIRKAGYHPVLAHPERYRYMDYDDYDELQDQGVRFQLNITSLAGAYGPTVKSRAEYLLEYGYYRYQGSDTHSLMSVQKALAEKAVKEKIMRILRHEQ